MKFIRSVVANHHQYALNRISCILIPAHPKYSGMTTAERMADDLLRKV